MTLTSSSLPVGGGGHVQRGVQRPCGRLKGVHRAGMESFRIPTATDSPEPNDASWENLRVIDGLGLSKCSWLTEVWQALRLSYAQGGVAEYCLSEQFGQTLGACRQLAPVEARINNLSSHPWSGKLLMFGSRLLIGQTPSVVRHS